MSRQLNSTAQIYDSAAFRRPCPRWFISRGGGVLVPLIAADELPLEVKLVGVPRGMDLDGAARMEFLGEYRHDGSVYALETPLADTHTEECDADTVNGNVDAETYDDRDSENHAPNRTRQKLSSNHTSHGFGDIHPLYGRKEYCTYWIRTGECAYTRQGCLYKHEMPDLATLERIGFRGVPRWWRTKPLKPRAVGYRSSYMSDRASRFHRDRSVTSSDESNAEINDSRSEGDHWNVENGESDAQITRSPTKSDTPPADAVKENITPPVRASGGTSALDDLIDLSINTVPSPSQKRTSSGKKYVSANHRPSSKAASSHKSSSVTGKERRTSSSSHSHSAENSSIESRHGKQPPSRSRTPASRRGKSDEEEPPLGFEPGPIGSPSRYRWDDSHDTASMSSDRERKAKDRNARASAKASKYART